MLDPRTFLYILVLLWFFYSKHFLTNVNFFNVLPFGLLFSILLINKNQWEMIPWCAGFYLFALSLTHPIPSLYPNPIFSRLLYSSGLCPGILTFLDCMTWFFSPLGSSCIWLRKYNMNGKVINRMRLKYVISLFFFSPIFSCVPAWSVSVSTVASPKGLALLPWAQLSSRADSVISCPLALEVIMAPAAATVWSFPQPLLVLPFLPTSL